MRFITAQLQIFCAKISYELRNRFVGIDRYTPSNVWFGR